MSSLPSQVRLRAAETAGRPGGAREALESKGDAKNSETPLAQPKHARPCDHSVHVCFSLLGDDPSSHHIYSDRVRCLQRWLPLESILSQGSLIEFQTLPTAGVGFGLHNRCICPFLCQCPHADLWLPYDRKRRKLTPKKGGKTGPAAEAATVRGGMSVYRCFLCDVHIVLQCFHSIEFCEIANFL